MARPRLRAALLAGAVLAAGLPVGAALAGATHLTCGVTQSGRWERIPVDSFPPVNGVSAGDTVTAYAVDELQPADLLATNGVRIKSSTTNGCSWTDSYALSTTPSAAQPFSALTARVVSLGLLGTRRLAAVQEGSGATSRPHVMVQTAGGGWAASDTGLPAQGAPRLLRVANDGRTVFLTVSPTATGGSDSGSTTGLVPGLPGGATSGGTPTGLLYASTDGGTSWSLRTGAGELPGGGEGFSALDVDPGDANHLYGIVGDQLVVSRDGGASFTAKASGISAVTAMGTSAVAAFRSAGGGLLSANGGTTFLPFPAPAGITSAAYRTGDSGLVVESSGVLRRVEPNNGQLTAVPAGVSARTGSLLGDRSESSSFHALAGHAVLRYVDPLVPGATIPKLAPGDLTAPPPLPGVVVPAVRSVTLPVGQSGVADFDLQLPKNPTPLDLFFVVDVSQSMKDYIENLQKNIRSIVQQLSARRINLKVGVATMGTGPARGEPEYADAYVVPPTTSNGRIVPGPAYVKPSIYRRIRPVGDTGPDLQRAVDAIRIETDSPRQCGRTSCEAREGALLALEQAARGLGVKNNEEARLGLPSYSAVPPNQQAGFRPRAVARRVIVLATDEAFDIPYDTPQKPGSTPQDPRPDFTRTLRMLNAEGIQVVGLSGGAEATSIGDLQTVAAGTRTFAPPGGVLCDDGRISGIPVTLRAGAPLVCNNADRFTDALVRLLASLVDRQDVSLVPARRSPVLGALDGHALLGLDVKRPNTASFAVRVSCVDVKPGRYAADVQAVLRRTTVGSARVDVTCVAAAAAARPRPVQAVGNPPPPPPQPVSNVVLPVAPPAPAAQPQVNPQVQTQVQVQPLTAGALQDQQELQLALALNGTLKDDDPVFSAGTQLAMVDRRRREEVQALGVLAFAMLTCAGAGLARLRARPEVQVRRAR